MMLNRQERRFYKVIIETDPPDVPGWEASFDGGVTWVPGELVDGVVRWLVNGPDFDPDAFTPATSVQIAVGVSPLFRLVDNPEVEITRGPSIILVT